MFNKDFLNIHELFVHFWKAESMKKKSFTKGIWSSFLNTENNLQKTLRLKSLPNKTTND